MNNKRIVSLRQVSLENPDGTSWVKQRSERRQYVKGFLRIPQPKPPVLRRAHKGFPKKGTLINAGHKHKMSYTPRVVFSS